MRWRQSGEGSPDDPPPGRRRRELRWSRAVLIMLVVVGAWSLATPLTAGADEYGHIFTAYAVAHGESGTTVHTPIGPLQEVKVPRDLLAYEASPGCFAFQANQPANCPPTTDLGPALVQFLSYPRPYYLLIGSPSLVLTGQAAFAAARGVTVLLCSLLLGTALWAHRRWWATSRAGLALLVAATPQVLNQAASLGSSGVEICAGLSLSVCLIVMARQSGPVERSLLVGAAVSAAALVQSRPLSPVWALTLILVALFVAGWRRTLELARDRAVQVAAGAVTAVTVAAVAWTAAQGNPQLLGQPDPRLSDGHTLFAAQVARIPYLWGGRIGRFGWGASQVPDGGMAIWAAAGAVLLIVAVVRCLVGPQRWTERKMLVCAVAIGVVVSLDTFVLEAPRAATVGLFWSSRYDMPIAVMIPMLLAGPPIAEVRASVRLLLRATAGVVLVVQGWTFVHVIHRYLVGQSTPLHLLEPTAWMPAVPWQLVVLLAAGGLLAWSVEVMRRPRVTRMRISP